MNSWKLQAKFVDKVLKGNDLLFDFSHKEESYAIGDSYHFYVIPIDDVYIDLIKISNQHRNLKRVKLLDQVYSRTDFSANATVKNPIRKFEYLDKEVWISEKYLKEFEFSKYCEWFQVGADPEDGYRKPVKFDCGDFAVVILPVGV